MKDNNIKLRYTWAGDTVKGEYVKARYIFASHWNHNTELEKRKFILDFSFDSHFCESIRLLDDEFVDKNTLFKFILNSSNFAYDVIIEELRELEVLDKFSFYRDGTGTIHIMKKMNVSDVLVEFESSKKGIDLFESESILKIKFDIEENKKYYSMLDDIIEILYRNNCSLIISNAVSDIISRLSYIYPNLEEYRYEDLFKEELSNYTDEVINDFFKSLSPEQIDCMKYDKLSLNSEFRFDQYAFIAYGNASDYGEEIYFKMTDILDKIEFRAIEFMNKYVEKYDFDVNLLIDKYKDSLEDNVSKIYKSKENKNIIIETIDGEFVDIDNNVLFIDRIECERNVFTDRRCDVILDILDDEDIREINEIEKSSIHFNNYEVVYENKFESINELERLFRRHCFGDKEKGNIFLAKTKIKDNQEMELIFIINDNISTIFDLRREIDELTEKYKTSSVDYYLTDTNILVKEDNRFIALEGDYIYSLDEEILKANKIYVLAELVMDK